MRVNSVIGVISAIGMVFLSACGAMFAQPELKAECQRNYALLSDQTPESSAFLCTCASEQFLQTHGEKPEKKLADFYDEWNGMIEKGEDPTIGPTGHSGEAYLLEYGELKIQCALNLGAQDAG